MPNLNIPLDPAVHRRAKALAAERELPLYRYVGEILRDATDPAESLEGEAQDAAARWQRWMALPVAPAGYPLVAVDPLALIGSDAGFLDWLEAYTEGREVAFLYADDGLLDQAESLPLLVQVWPARRADPAGVAAILKRLRDA